MTPYMRRLASFLEPHRERQHQHPLVGARSRDWHDRVGSGKIVAYLTTTWDREADDGDEHEDAEPEGDE